MDIDVMKFIDAGATPEEIYAAAKKAAQEKKEKDAADLKIKTLRDRALDAVIKYAEGVIDEPVSKQTIDDVEQDLIDLERVLKKMRKPVSAPKVEKREAKSDNDVLFKFLGELGLLD